MAKQIKPLLLLELFQSIYTRSLLTVRNALRIFLDFDQNCVHNAGICLVQSLDWLSLTL